MKFQRTAPLVAAALFALPAAPASALSTPTPGVTPSPAPFTPGPTPDGANPSPPLPTPAGPNPSPGLPRYQQSAVTPIQCKFPLIGVREGTLYSTVYLPPVVSVGSVASPDVYVTASFGDLSGVQGLPASVGGTMFMNATLVRPVLQSTPLGALITAADVPFNAEGPQGFRISGGGTLQRPFTVASSDKHTIRLDRFTMNLAARDASGAPVVLPPASTDIFGNPAIDTDGLPETFDVSCKVAPDAGGSSTIATFNDNSTPTPKPTPTQTPTPTPAPPTPTPTLPPGTTPEPTVVPSPWNTPLPTPVPTPPAAVTPGTHATTITYQCKWPRIGLRNLTLKLTAGFPEAVPRGTTQTVPLDASLEFPFFVEGFDWPERSYEGKIGLDIDTFSPAGTLTQQRVMLDAPAVQTPSGSGHPPLVLKATGSFNIFVAGEIGLYSARLSRVQPNLVARDSNGNAITEPPLITDVDGFPVADSDGAPSTFDVSCKQTSAPPADTIGSMRATSEVQATPTPPVVTPIATSVPTPTPTPEIGGPTPRYAYALQGSTTLNTLTKGTMPLTGSVNAQIALSTGALTADLQLNDTQGRLTALGFLPVTATVGFVPSGPTTGKLVDDQLTTNSKVRIKVKSVKAFGAIPLAGGNTCQTKQLSDITLKSTSPFDPLGTGGTLAGTYAISDLNGCGPLGGLVSPITAGGGNTISVKLAPKS